jgi:hypothetical protein
MFKLGVLRRFIIIFFTKKYVLIASCEADEIDIEKEISRKMDLYLVSVLTFKKIYFNKIRGSPKQILKSYFC